MNGRIARQLKKEATPKHPYSKLKKEYKALGKSQSPKFKESKRSKRGVVTIAPKRKIKRTPSVKPAKYLKKYGL